LYLSLFKSSEEIFERLKKCFWTKKNFRNFLDFYCWASKLLVGAFNFLWACRADSALQTCVFSFPKYSPEMDLRRFSKLLLSNNWFTPRGVNQSLRWRHWGKSIILAVFSRARNGPARPNEVFFRAGRAKFFVGPARPSVLFKFSALYICHKQSKLLKKFT